MFTELLQKYYIKKEEKISKKPDIAMYFVTNSKGKQMMLNEQIEESDMNLDNVYCITSTLDEATEYIDVCIYNIYKPQYLDYCDGLRVDSEDVNNWYEFIENVIGLERLGSLMSNYSVIKKWFSRKDIAQVLRSIQRYKNIGCSFEVDYDEMRSNMSEEKTEEQEDIFEYSIKKEN